MEGNHGAWVGRAHGALGAFALALAGWYPGNNPDTFGHLAQGRQIAQLGSVPQLDTWSLLPGPARPWHNYEWLSDLGTWTLFDQHGYAAVTIFKCALLALAALAACELAQHLIGPRGSVLTSCAILAIIPAIRSRLSDRPHVLGLCLGAAYLLILSLLSRSTHRRTRIALVSVLGVLHVVWVNAHGSHLLGLGIGLCFLALGAPSLRRWFALVVGVQLVASCISPYGPAISTDAIAHVFDGRYRSLVTEWAAWQAHDPAWLQLGPALHAALLAVIAPLAWRRPLLRPMLPLALVLAAACFRSIRFVAEFMVLTAPLLGVGLALLSRRLRTGWFVTAASVLSLALVIAIPVAARELPPGGVFGARLSYAGTPRAAAAMLAHHGRSPRVFAAMQDSWFTMYAAPNSRFALDGRVPFYGPEWVQRVSRAFGDRASFDTLTRELDVNVVIASHAGAGEHQLSSFIAPRTGWSLVMIEDLHATYVRDDLLDAKGAGLFPPLRALQPSYALGWILDADLVQQSRMREELTRLAQVEGTSAYRAWVLGALTLAPLKRGHGSDGFRWPRNVGEWQLYRDGYSQITRAAEQVRDVPVVASLHAALAATFCDFRSAETSLGKALADGPSREPLLASQELALRRGRVDEVRRVVEAARALPQGQRDPWLAELHAGLMQPPTCPHP
ncbi:MAG TPA: hypothetical protein VFX59_07100 [Polyangiales bacterium]|nr:hypothetical protein [Polyangiales bacterium]